MLRYSRHKMMLNLSRKLHNFCKVQESNIFSRNINDVIVKSSQFKNWSYPSLSGIAVKSTSTNVIFNITVLPSDKLKQSLLFRAWVGMGLNLQQHSVLHKSNLFYI